MLTCDEYNTKRQGRCGRPLDEHGQCDRASEHGDHLADRGGVDRAWCPVCRRMVLLLRDGTYRRHRGGDEFDQATDGVCSMSGALPEVRS